MELNFEVLAEQEVQRQVKEKLGKKLHLEIQKEMKKYDYKKDISMHVDNGLRALLNNIDLLDLLDLIDVEKVQTQIAHIVSQELIDRMSRDTDDCYR